MDLYNFLLKEIKPIYFCDIIIFRISSIGIIIVAIHELHKESIVHGRKKKTYSCFRSNS